MSLSIVRPPKGHQFREYDCSRCTATGLKHPVFLSDGTVVGSECACRLTGMPERKVHNTAVRYLEEAKVSNREADARCMRYQKALRSFRDDSWRDPTSDFQRLRMEYASRNPDLKIPAKFAAYLEGEIRSHCGR